MTREEVRRRAEIMSAYANGKEIEMLNTDGNWVSIKKPKFYWGIFEYRIKKEPTYRPFKDKDECWVEMQKHQPFGWLIETLSNAYVNINGIDSVCVACDEYTYRYNEAFEEFTFVDGTPFGINED